jgi:glucose dehydrogenase
VRTIILAKAVVLSIAAALCIATPARADQSDDTRLLGAAADSGNWLMYGRTYDNQRFSPLDQVTPQTVKRLVPKWIYQTGLAATFQTSPIVSDGVMYLSAPFSHVMAVDAATGKELWRYEHKSTAKKLCCGPANRGVGIGGGKVFVATVDARLVALDQKTGKVLWDTPLVDKSADAAQGATEDKSVLAGDALKGQNVTGSTGVGAVAAPLVANGLVITGITGVGYGLHLDSDRPGAPLGAVVGVSGMFGRPGFVAAFDAGTGKKVWQFDTTVDGWEGEFRATTPDGVPLNRDIVAERAAAPKHKDAWRHGGGSFWHTPAYDPERKEIYFGIGNPSPQAADETRPGDNLHTSSIVALDVTTGKLKWAYQQIPHDVWGYDVASAPILFNLKTGGEDIPALAQASKLGWVYVHDRRDGKLLFKSDAFVPQDNLFKRPTAEGVRVAPGVGGGANWSPVSFDPSTGAIYVAAMHMPTVYRTAVLPADGDKPALPYAVMEPAKEPNWGTLTALDLTNGGKTIWQVKTNEPLVGGTLATAGGLVFTGEGNGDFSAFDGKSGERLWRFNCGAGVNAPPISFSLGGKQYVAVAAGGSQIWGFRQGGAVVVFGLAD